MLPKKLTMSVSFPSRLQVTGVPVPQLGALMVNPLFLHQYVAQCLAPGKRGAQGSTHVAPGYSLCSLNVSRLSPIGLCV